jgi:putative transcriptional regulator
VSDLDLNAQRLSNRLKVLRAERNLTQQQLAELVGVTRKTINTVERGVFVPSTLLAFKLARVLRVSVDEVFSLCE